MAVAMAVLVVGAVVFFGSDRLVVVLEVVDLVVAGCCHRDLCGRGLGGVLLLLTVSACLGVNSII